MALGYEGLTFLRNTIEVVSQSEVAQPVPPSETSQIGHPGKVLEPATVDSIVGDTPRERGVGCEKQEVGRSVPGEKISREGQCLLQDADMLHDRECLDSAHKEESLSSQHGVATYGNASRKSSNVAEAPSQGGPVVRIRREAPSDADCMRSPGSMYASAEERTESESSPCSPVSHFLEELPRSVSNSQLLSSSRQRQIDTLEVQLAVKDSEIHCLADVFSGTEWALAEREREARHLSALVDNLEQQIAAKNEVLDLSEELTGSLEERLVAMEVQKDAFEARAGEYQQSVIDLQLEVERLSADLLSLRHETGVNAARNQELEGLVRSLEGRLGEESRKNAANLLDVERQAAEKVKGLNHKICRLQKRLLETAEVLRVSAETVGGLKRQLLEKDRAPKEGKADAEKALQAQAKVLRGAEMRIAVLEQDVLRKAGNLEAVEVHVADLQRQLEEKECECAYSRESVNGLLLQLEAEGEHARSLQGELEKERERRLQVEKELQKKDVELKLNGELIAKMRRETAANRPMEQRALRAEMVAQPSADSEESASSQAGSPASKSSLGYVESTQSGQSASSLGSASCESSDAESIAQTLNEVQGEDISSGPSLVSFLEENAKVAECRMGAEEGSLMFWEKCAEMEASSSGAIGLLACRSLDLGGRQTSPELGLGSGPNADSKGLTFIGIEVTCSTSTRMYGLGILKKLLRVVSRRCCRENMDDSAAGQGLKGLLPNSSHSCHVIELR